MTRIRTTILIALAAVAVLALSTAHTWAAVVNATYTTGAEVPVSSSHFTATAKTVNFTLNFAPAEGTELMVVRNTGPGPIIGTFKNLTHGQTVKLSYGGVTYHFVANYHGGQGHDLVLLWTGDTKSSSAATLKKLDARMRAALKEKSAQHLRSANRHRTNGPSVSKKSTRLPKPNDPETGNPADDLEGALEYEFNMTKDPATGRIPEGIFEAEHAQANEIVQQAPLLPPDLDPYSFVGPDNLGGRTRAIAYDVRFGVAGNQTILAGGVSGGVFKSINNGVRWLRKSPAGQHFSCTSIAQDPRAGFQDTWYYTVGEAIGNTASAVGASYRGNGVYKSTNNGNSWTRLPASNTGSLEEFDNLADLITKVVVDPLNGNVYIAAVATIRRSTDGGASWSDVLSGASPLSNHTTDIVVTSTGRFYAAFSGTSSVGADGVWTSTTGASGSWTRIAGPGGTPVGWNANAAYGRVVLAIAPSSENLVYALYYNNFTSGCPSETPPGTAGLEAELFRWNKTTNTWTNLSNTLPDEPGCLRGNDPFAVQAGYDLVVAVKPDDPATIFIGGTNIYRSSNAGANWTRIGGFADTSSSAMYANSHADIHSIVFQPASPSIMLCGNDGGIQRTTNNLAPTVAWTQINSGYRTYQYYYVVNDPVSGSSKVLGGAHDNGTTRNIGGVGNMFELVWGGDGASVGLSNPAATGGTQYEYVGSQKGKIYRRAATADPNIVTNIRPVDALGDGLFVTLFKLDPDNTQTLYYANGSTLYLTTAARTVTPATWTTMAGMANAVGGASITAIGLSRGPYDPAKSSLFVGTSNGKLFRLDDPTTVPTAAPFDITGTASGGGAAFPVGAYVSSISTHPTNDSIVLVTFSNYNVISVFWTNSANSATPFWKAVEGNLTLPSYRSSAIVATGAGGVQYYVGTSAGLYNVSGLPASPVWKQKGANDMGSAVISSLDLRVPDGKLLVGTHGLGMWFRDPRAAVLNLSTLMNVGFTGAQRNSAGGGPLSLIDDSPGIAGFIITGSDPKHVLVRAIGPSLTNFGLSNVLADPVLELHGQAPFVTITNDNWRDDAAQEVAIMATGIPPTNNLESAIDATLDPGAYTAIVRGKNNTAGAALVEVYDLDLEASSKLANISTRAYVGTGNNIVIAGFILGHGESDCRIVVRGIGPSLAAFGVPDTLADPILELRDSNGTLLVSNNDWQDNSAQAAELTAAGLAPANNFESGIAATLPPGPYTALLAGLNNGTGVGLVEVYDRGPP